MASVPREREPVTGLDRWRIERAGGTKAGTYGHGWYAVNIRTGVGAWKPTHADALRFARAMIRAQASRIGVDIAAAVGRVRTYEQRRVIGPRLRSVARLIR